MGKHSVLILSTRNAARSQMAEALLRAYGSPLVEVESAGLMPAHEIDPLAIEVMREVGLDISNRKPKNVRRFIHQEWDDVITLCARPAIARPAFSGPAVHIHWGFYDPQLANGTEEERFTVFRRVRDDIQRVFRVYSRGIIRNLGSSFSTAPAKESAVT